MDDEDNAEEGREEEIEGDKILLIYYTSILFKSCGDPQPLLVRMRQSLLETVKPTHKVGEEGKRKRIFGLTDL